ncbi:hypothetical protein BFP70_19290 [Thioclava sp. SK-1]|uniref:phospholipase D-like domain-containing protein n=1 Tax=Thioclava sp. SK-1 TaxID=1889770 RepID=UPI00082597A6|nr:phospholipase D-like domain-containing protein [Thioclava sp. SK-1]OCX58198.1 hypothetical protein BFP70_19290 [Thioclava sp. SK-1]
MSWLIPHLTIVAIGIVFVITASLVLQEHRPPQSTLAWLVFIALLPYVAVPAFLALGVRKRRAARHLPPMCPIDAPPGLQSLLTGYGIAAPTCGNTISLQTEGKEAYHAVMDVVAGAQHSIWITLYALGDDPVGRAFCDALRQRADEGVQVCLILDWVGALRRPRQALRALRHAKGQVCIYSPLLHGPFGGRANLRNHRKMVIADGTRVWAGGRNIAHDYLGPTPDPTRWQDLSFILSGPAASGFCDLFINDWRAAGGTALTCPEEPAEMGQAQMRLLPSGPDTARDPLHDALIYTCHNASQKIWIVTPYFIPTDGLMQALSMAGRRGLDVRIVVPETSNQRFADLARGAYMRGLAADGCRIFMVPDAMVHAKAVLIDDHVFIGSANFDARSLMLNFELMLMTQDSSTRAQLEHWVRSLLSQSQEQVPVSRGLRRLIESLVRLTSPML